MNVLIQGTRVGGYYDRIMQLQRLVVESAVGEVLLQVGHVLWLWETTKQLGNLATTRILFIESVRNYHFHG